MISIGISIPFLIFGYLIYVKEKFNLINDFTEQKKKGFVTDAYAKRIGFIELITGIVCCVYGGICLMLRVGTKGIFGTVLICAVAIAILALIMGKKY